MANTITSNELNVVQGFGERQLLRTLASSQEPVVGGLVKLDSDGNFTASVDGDAGTILFVVQNDYTNKDSLGTAYDFVGVDAKVIGIPVSSGAEVQIPVADTTTFTIGGTVDAGAGVIALSYF